MLNLLLYMYMVLMRCRMTIGWVEEFVRDGEAVEGFQG